MSTRVVAALTTVCDTVCSRLPESRAEAGTHPDSLYSTEEAEYSERVLRVIRHSPKNMDALLKLLRELRGSTARLNGPHFPLSALRAIMSALLTFVGTITASRGSYLRDSIGDSNGSTPVPSSTFLCIETVLSISQHHGLLDPMTLADPQSMLALLEQSPWSEEVLSHYGIYLRSVLIFNAPYVESKTVPPADDSKSRSPEALQARSNYFS